MGRKRKEGLNYFPLDTDMFKDIKVRKLMRYRKDGGVTVYLFLLCAVYENGYYLKWHADLPFEVSEQTGLDEEEVRRAIGCCLDLGLFSRRMLEEEGVLTSASIQRRYARVCRLCRKRADIGPYALEEAQPAPAEGPGRTPPGGGGGRLTAYIFSAEGMPVSSAGNEDCCGGPTEARLVDVLEAGCVAADGAGGNGVCSERMAINSERIPPKIIEEKETKVSSPLKSPRGDGGKEGEYLSSPLSRRDGRPRNYDGLRMEMNRLGIPRAQQESIARLSNYGEIGHAVWPLISRCVASLNKAANDRDRIRMPGSFILAKLKEQAGCAPAG